jgi:hypothetical protein
MSYAHWTTVTGGITVGTWEPHVRSGAALLLGNTPNGWQAAAPSRLPRALTSVGVQCITVDVPNWGNSTDVAAIGTALTWAAGRGIPLDRLMVYAYGRGAVAALNWAARNVDRAAALALVAPIVDLEERYARVPADQASLDAAYGGSLATAAATWNPSAAENRNWGRRVLEHLADRVTMWWAPTDTVTPDAVHQALADYYTCATGDLDNPDPTVGQHDEIVAQGQAQAAAWCRAASVLQQRWNAKRRDNTSTTDWGGSDGNHRILLPDGRAVWTQNDYRTGTVNADETRSGGGITHNAGVVQEVDGSLGATLFFTGSSGVWLRPPDHPTGYYWLNGGIVEDGNLYVLALHLVGPTVDDIHIVTVNPATLVQAAEQARGHQGYGWAYPVAESAHTYITGSAPAGFLQGRTGLARAAAGDFTGPWEFWDGAAWSPTETDAVPLRDVDGNELPLGAGGMVHIPDGPWLIASVESALHDTIHVYRSPDGPYSPNSWRHHGDIRCTPHADLTYAGLDVPTYGANDWYLDDLPNGRALLAYTINHAGAGAGDSGLYQAQFRGVEIAGNPDCPAWCP